MKSSILNAIQCDIVEIIIVKSDNYDLFLRLQDLLVKLKEQSRVSRINDKLTETTIFGTKIFDTKICYILNGKLHREYNKPSEIYINSGEYNYYTFGNLHSNHGCPANITLTGRCWRKDCIIYRDDDLPSQIIYNGRHAWDTDTSRSARIRNNKLPIGCSSDGIRNPSDRMPFVSIFKYIKSSGSVANQDNEIFDFERNSD